MKTTSCLLLALIAAGLAFGPSAQAAGGRGASRGAGNRGASNSSATCTLPQDGSGQTVNQRGTPNSTGTPRRDGSGKATAPGKGPKDGTGNNANCTLPPSG